MTFAVESATTLDTETTHHVTGSLPSSAGHGLRGVRRPRRPRHYALVARILRRRGEWLHALRTRCSLHATPLHLSTKHRKQERLPYTFGPFASHFTSMAQAPRLLSMSYPNDSGSHTTKPTCLHTTPSDYPIVIDTGASISVSPNINDFVDGISEANVHDLKGLNHSTKVHGMGMVEWTIYDVYHSVKTIRTMAFYVPDATIRLFSPQTYFFEGGGRGHLHCDKDQAILLLHNGDKLTFPYNCETNLPFMLPATKTKSKKHSLTFPTSERAVAGLTHADVTSFSDPDSLMSLMTVADEANQNLTAAQKELLHWHWKLGHCNFQWIQALAAKPLDENGTALLQTKHKISVALAPLCAACQLAKQKRRSADVATEMKLEDRDMLLKQNNTEPGDCVSIDQYASTVLGRLPHTRGKEKKDEKFNGGTVFVDHATGYVHLEHQVSMRAGETIASKTAFERFAMQHGVQVKRYRADNHPFGSKEFQESLDSTRQTLTFSGVGAKHQNGVAERAIQTITSWARAMMLHSILHWPESANLELWPFAMAHAVYLWNHIPRKDIKKSPYELFTKSVMPSEMYLQRQHVWGCPTYVLDPKLQDGKKLPKWDPRVRRGQFLGFSQQHSSTIGLILNHLTGSVTPQYHCVYDDLYTTVPNGVTVPPFDTTEFDPETWERLISNGGHERVDWVGNDALSLDPDWMTEAERQALRRPAPRTDDHEGPLRSFPREPTTPSTVGDDDLREDPASRTPRTPLTPVPSRVTFEPGTAPPVRDLAMDFEGERDEVSTSERQIRHSPPPSSPTRRSTRDRKPNRKFRGDEWVNYQKSRVAKQRVRTGLLNEQYLQSLDWNMVISQLRTGHWKAMATYLDLHTTREGHLLSMHPLSLAAKANAEDNPRWNEAMNGPNAEGFWDAMCKEVTTLTDQKDAWEVVSREAWMNVLPSTWAFKCKRFPDGLIKKLKARFCVRGDKQLEGVDFFETFAPVVSWSTIRLMLILSLVLGLATRQVDYTAAFLHAPIDEDVYVEMPRGFSEPGKVLKLKKSLYGLKQAPRNFFQHLKNKLERIGFTSSSADPCLFISERVICIVYVDDTLLFSPRQEYIDDVLSKLKEEELDLEEEDDVAGFLGVNVQRDDENGQIHMTQLGLIDRIIDALGCDSLPGKRTPAEHGALGSDKGGDPPQASFSYASVIGMLQYLQAHTRPDITLAVSQCARFIHSTRRSHELALIRIGQYLKLTRTRGLTLRPTTTMSIDCYVDADFAGLWGFEDPQDPTCVKSRTGYVLCLSGCPIIWASKLQSDIALSTMEAEYNALSMALKELLPLKRLVETVAGAVQIPLHPTTAMRVTVWEDNTGALTLANLEPGRMTPRSKHYGVKYHWFREHLKPNCIEVVKIDTDDQQADILTKALRTHKFEHNRRQLMGWSATLWGSQLRSKGSVKILANTVRYHASPGIARLRAHQSRYT